MFKLHAWWVYVIFVPSCDNKKGETQWANFCYHSQGDFLGYSLHKLTTFLLFNHPLHVCICMGVCVWDTFTRQARREWSSERIRSTGSMQEQPPCILMSQRSFKPTLPLSLSVFHALRLAGSTDAIQHFVSDTTAEEHLHAERQATCRRCIIDECSSKGGTERGTKEASRLKWRSADLSQRRPGCVCARRCVYGAAAAAGVGETCERCEWTGRDDEGLILQRHKRDENVGVEQNSRGLLGPIQNTTLQWRGQKQQRKWKYSDAAKISSPPVNMFPVFKVLEFKFQLSTKLW